MTAPFVADTRPIGPYTIGQWHQVALGARAVPPTDPRYPRAQQALAYASRAIKAWAADRQQENAYAAQQDRVPQTTGGGAYLAGFGQGATSGFADELAGLLSQAGDVARGGFSGPSMAAAGVRGVQDQRDYLAAARQQHPLATMAGDLVGSTALATIGGAGATALAPGISTTLATATEPAQGFIGMISRHAPQKLATAALGGLGSGALLGARAAGESDGGPMDRLKAGAIGFGVGTAIGTPLALGAAQATVMGRTLASGLRPVTQSARQTLLRALGGTPAVESALPAVEGAVAPMSRAEQAMQIAAAREARAAELHAIRLRMAPLQEDMKAAQLELARARVAGIPNQVALAEARVQRIGGDLALHQARVAAIPDQATILAERAARAPDETAIVGLRRAAMERGATSTGPAPTTPGALTDQEARTAIARVLKVPVNHPSVDETLAARASMSVSRPLAITPAEVSPSPVVTPAPSPHPTRNVAPTPAAQSPIDPSASARAAHALEMARSGDPAAALAAARRSAGVAQGALAEQPVPQTLDRSLQVHAILQQPPSNANREALLAALQGMSDAERRNVAGFIQRGYPVWWRILSSQ